MTRNLRRSAAGILALLIAFPSPNLWARTIAAPVASRGTTSGIVTVTPVLPSQVLSGMPLSGLGTLSGPGLSATLTEVPRVLPSAALAASAVMPVAPQGVGAAVMSAPALAAPAASQSLPASPASPAATAVKVSRMADEVGGLIEAAGDQSQASPESAQGLGSQVIRALTGEASARGGAVAADPAAGPLAAPTAVFRQQKMLQTLYQVAAIFAEQYAPIEWKKEKFQVDLNREYEKARAAIVADPQMSTRQFQDLIYNLTAAMRDYHVSVSFNSTERAVLPFAVTLAGGKYFLSYIDREKLPMKIFPFRVGDEVVAFNGQRTADAVRSIAAEKGANVPETDLRLAELFLTNRRRARGDHVPQGNVQVIIRGRNNKLSAVVMPWDYTPELVAQDVPLRDAGLFGAPMPALTRPGSEKAGPASPADLKADDIKRMAGRFLAGRTAAPAAAPAKAEGLMGLLGRTFDNAVHPLADVFAEMTAEARSNPFMMGARKSFVPRLGEILWESDKKNHFQAYIFKTKDGRKAGFIRIAAYDGGAKEVKQFGEIMAKFQKETDALVIDQVNNPGGIVTYLYALASHLTDKPLVTPHHRLVIGASEAQQAADLLLKVMRPDKHAAKKDPEEKEKPTASGYPITKKFITLLVQYSQFVLQQFNSGKRFTDLTWEGGVDEIDPAPKASERYTKPILLLTNALDFSGGDFFPAIMQDNKRVTQLGVRTAGAGGMVRPFDVPNQFGIDGVHATWSIAQRPNGQPIENLGVKPDIPYDLTEKDLRTGYAEYRYTIIKALQRLLDGAKAAK